MYKKKNDSYGVIVAADGTLKRGRLQTPTLGRHNSEGYLPTLPEPSFSQNGGIRANGSVSITLSHAYNQDAAPNNDVTILYTTNCATPTEFSDMWKYREIFWSTEREGARTPTVPEGHIIFNIHNQYCVLPKGSRDVTETSNFRTPHATHSDNQGSAPEPGAACCACLNGRFEVPSGGAQSSVRPFLCPLTSISSIFKF
jgi:hypothetical protein